jgi:arylsulfatase A-like enzyme
MRGDGDLYEGKVSVERIGYTTEMLTRRSVEYVSKRGKGKGKGDGAANPFYLSLHYTAPHWPWEGPNDQEVSRTLGGGYNGFTAGGSLKTYAAMMKSLDDGIGEVLRAVDRAGLTRNTLVIFTSDNGGERFSYQWPFRGQKFSLWEGGIRVPAIVRWPGVTPVGVITQQAAITMDWTRTMLAAGNAQPNSAYPLDGNDLIPVIRGTQSKYERTFFWRTSLQEAMLKGHWKYLKDGTDEYLFDLSVDEREQANFREKNPKMFAQLRDEYRAWDSTVLPRPSPRQR